MKLDNNIDDIFKEGLEGYSEQPSKALWKKVSGGLLRHEISHFNFTNFPKLWSGVAAASIVAVSLIIFNPLINKPVDNAVATAIEKETPVIENNQPGQTIFIPSDKGPQSQPGDLTTLPSAGPGAVDLSPGADGKIISGGLDTENRFGDQAQKDLMLPVFEEKDAISFVENADEQHPSGTTLQDQSGLATAVAATTVAESNLKPAHNSNITDTGSGEPKITTTELPEDVEISHLGPRDVNLSAGGTKRMSDEIHVLGQPSVLITNFDRAGHESGKIQKMHSLSYSFGQFFKGKYKPPKRRFNESSSALFMGNTPYFSVSAYFSPEFTEYTRMASTSRELSYIGGLAVSYNSSRFIVEGGIEYSYSYDLGDYMVDMQTFDSIGYFNEVGGFIQDPNNPDSVIFETNEVPVFDSVQHNLHQQTQNHYSYLQFPLMIGYQAVERGIFSAYIKAGPSFSFLLNRQEPTLNYYKPDATINQIENYTPTRMNTGIQILVSVSLKFQLSEKLGILVEPTYRYYLKSVYDNTNSSLKNPYGIGIRGGLYFDL